MNFQAVTVIMVLAFLAFVGFFIYFVFKQLQFVIQAINLYKKMVTRQDMMIKLLKEIRTGSLAMSSGKRTSMSPSNLQKAPDRKSLVTEDGSIIERGFEALTGSTIGKESMTGKEIEKLKSRAGKDAKTFAYLTELDWICICGTRNPLDRSATVQNCSNCHRNRNYVLKNFNRSSFSKPK